MKRSITLRLGTLWLGLMAFALLPAFAQTPATMPMGKVHGRVTNPTGAPQKGGTVTFQGSKATAMPGAKNGEAAILNVDDNGTYSGQVPAGTFTVLYRTPGLDQNQVTDSFKDIHVVADQDTEIDVDMTRKEYVDALPPEQRKQLEELRKKNQEAMAANAVIKNLNNDLKQVNEDIHEAEIARQAAIQALGANAGAAEIAAKENEIKTAKYTDIETLMTKDTAVKGDASVLWAELGQGQLGLKKYDAAEVSFKKALELESTSKKPSLQVQGLAQSGLGEIYARTGKVQDANTAFEAAAKLNPAQAVFYYKNEAVIFSQVGNSDGQVSAANAGIKAMTDTGTKFDANSAVLYYLKGQALVAKATIDSQSGKMVLPDGCADSYQKYLELAPNGVYAPEVKAILAEAQQTHGSSYGIKSSGKKK